MIQVISLVLIPMIVLKSDGRLIMGYGDVKGIQVKIIVPVKVVCTTTGYFYPPAIAVDNVLLKKDTIRSFGIDTNGILIESVQINPPVVNFL